MGRRKLTADESTAHRKQGMEAAKVRRDSLDPDPDAWSPDVWAKELPEAWGKCIADAPKPADLAGMTMLEAYKALGLVVEETGKDGKTKIADGKGFAVDPRLVTNLMVLNLDGIDYAIVMRIMFHHWNWSDPPFLKLSRIAASLGLSVAAVRKRIRRMEEMKYVRVIARVRDDGTDSANGYDFRPLLYAHAAVEKTADSSSRPLWDRAMLNGVKLPKRAKRHYRSSRPPDAEATPLPQSKGVLAPEQGYPSPSARVPLTQRKGTLPPAQAHEVEALEVEAFEKETLN